MEEVTPQLIRFYDRRARHLRAAAQAAALRGFFRLPLMAVERLLATLRSGVHPVPAPIVPAADSPDV